MAAVLSFTKMQGLGNDFIVIDDFFSQAFSDGRQKLAAELAKKLCDRRWGIGADQILWLKSPSPHATAHFGREIDFKMEVLNADGSAAEMCGNGIRAAALYFHRRTSTPSSLYEIETLAGVISAQVISTETAAQDARVKVAMGMPRMGAAGLDSSRDVFRVGEVLNVAGKSFRFFEVNLGNPHAVIFVDRPIENPADFLAKVGPEIEDHPRFPERTNVEFVYVESANTISVNVWERGAGITLACGTGACAAAVASIATGRVFAPVSVRLPGGELRIAWDNESDSPVSMEGPAEEVFSGQYPITD